MVQEDVGANKNLQIYCYKKLWLRLATFQGLSGVIESLSLKHFLGENYIKLQNKKHNFVVMSRRPHLYAMFFAEYFRQCPCRRLPSRRFQGLITAFTGELW